MNNSKAAVSECLGAWLNYLNSLNNLCASGYRLSQTIANLDQGPLPVPPMNPAQCAWGDLARASAVATSTVKSHVVAVLQEFVTQPVNTTREEQQQMEMEAHRVREHNQGIISEVLQTMINLQHQFCIASYDSFAHLLYAQQQQHQQHLQMLEASDNYPSMMLSSNRSRTTSPHFQGHHSAALHEQQGGPRGASPHQDIRGPSPIQGFLDNVRGPLPNPGHLLGMKAPFYRGSRSPLNFPLFPLAGQRRWSEAAAAEVGGGDCVLDAESQMRRWSMPWEATKTDRNWQHQTTRILPVSKLSVPPGSGYNQMVVSGGSGSGGMSSGGMQHPHTSRSCSDRSQSTTPDSAWQSSITSQDGLAEAIQLLSCKPANRYQGPMGGGQQQQQQHSMGAPFIEEPPLMVGNCD